MDTNSAAWRDQARNGRGEFGHRLHPEHDTFTPPADDTETEPGRTAAPISEAELHARFMTPDGDVTRQAVDDTLDDAKFNTRATSWQELMGAQRRTTANLQRYRQAKLAAIDADPELHAEFRRRVRQLVDHRQRKATHALAFEAGVPTVFDEHFDDMWEGRTPGGGFSKEKLQADVESSRALLEGLNAGRVKPSTVVGAGYRNAGKVARDYLENTLARLERDLATHGRSNSVNIANAEYRHRHGG